MPTASSTTWPSIPPAWMGAAGAATPASAPTWPCGCPRPPLEAGIWAAAVTSLKVETLGPFNRPIREVEDFIQQHYNHGSNH